MLNYSIKKEVDGMRYNLIEGSPSDLNLSISALTQPSGTIRWFLDFYKLSDYIIDVGLFIEFQNPGLIVSQVIMDFPVILTDLLPTITPSIVQNTIISPIKPCAFFANETDPIVGWSWIRFHNGMLQFKMVPPTNITLFKVQSEFRYQKYINIINV